MSLSGSVKKLSAYIGDADTYADKPMYEEKHGMKMSVDLPLVVQVVDRADKVTALAEVYSAMIGAGLVTIENVNVLVYRGSAEE